MDTPEAAKRASGSPSVQDSPFFSYISSLSPIKTFNAGNASHGDLSVPSPQPVFTSPHMNLPQKLNLLRRSQRLSGSVNFSPGFADADVAHLEATETCGPSLSAQVLPLIPCTQGHDNDDSSQDHSSSSHSSCVDEFLADPVGDSDNPSASPGLCLKQAAELTCSSQGGDNNIYKKVKQSDGGDRGEAQSCSPSASVEKVTGHPESLNATDLPNTHVKKPTYPPKASQGEYAMLREVPPTYQAKASDDEYAMLKETPMELLVSEPEKGTDSSASLNLKSSFQAEDSIGQGPSSPVNLVETEVGLKIFHDTMEINEKSHKEQLEQVSKSVNSHTNAGLPLVQALGAQSGHLPVDQIALNKLCLMSRNSDVMDHGEASNSTPQVQPKPIENIKDGEDPHDDAGAKSNLSAGNGMPYEQQEGLQHQRCMRKRLQFESVEVHDSSSGRDENSWNSAAFSNAEPPETPLDLENPNFTHAESVGTSSNKKTTRLLNPSGNALSRLSQCSYRTAEAPAGKVDKPVQPSGCISSTVPRPSGIGLHLNSIGNAAPMNFNTSMQFQEKDIIVKGKNSLSENKVSLDPTNCLASTSLKLHCSAKLTASSENPVPCANSGNSEEELQENQQMELQGSSIDHQSLLDVKPLNISPHSKLIDCYVTPCNMKRLQEHSSRSEESNQTSPRKKRKKTSDNDGCKRCNCKRSKCLKLYCDCFAAGAYCTEDCACQECFNRPEHQDVVLGTRQQIESRNPLAFAPKVVIRVTESQKDNGDSKHITPSSARHKRGCNCKKSLCLKKYCECYQAGVGCSLGCRCEGCKNSFGRKDGLGDATELEHKILQKEIEHKKFTGVDLDVASSGGKLEGIEVRSETINAKQCHSRLSPLTPLLQGSCEHDVLSKSQFPLSYYPSPGAGASLLPSFMESPSSPRILASSNTSRELREGCSSPLPYDHGPECHAAAKLDTFSPGWDGFPDICNLSPLPNFSPAAEGSSSASQTRERKILQTKLFQGSGRISGGTLRWRCSPITPLPRFGEGKFVFEPDSDSGQHNIAQDDTPDVLKDTLSPIKAVKATSPNQKRVSPPNKALHESCQRISPGIKSGRKFILQSVPSFPPLTPYSNNTSGNGT